LKSSGENIVELIVKYIDSTITESELIELKTAMEENPESRRLFDECIDVWQSSHTGIKTPAYDENAAWLKLKNNPGFIDKRSHNKSTYQRFGWIRQIAAAALVIITFGTIGMVLYQNNFKNQSLRANTEYYVPYGSRSKVILPDGSAVWLNAGSKLIYNSFFNQKNREVFLEGEGYFDVTKHKKLPFFVKVTGATVKVLGTAFNVKAYPEEKVIETTVTRGIVQVFNTQDNIRTASRILLQANQKVSITKYKYTQVVSPDNSSKPDNQVIQPSDYKAGNAGQFLTVDRNIEPEIYTSWKDQRWIIEREDMQSLAIKLERRYNVTISFKDESLKRYVFSGILKDETLEQVLEVIKLTAPINYQINQNKVILYKNKYFKTN
jgi:transmembrane sensor